MQQQSVDFESVLLPLEVKYVNIAEHNRNNNIKSDIYDFNMLTFLSFLRRVRSPIVIEE